MKDGPSRFGLSSMLVALGLLVAGPFLIVWAMNILFGLGIGYTWQTWVATVILLGAAKASASKLDK
jgi:hypothetical protein